MKKMNIAMVNTELTRGGAARVAASLVNAMNNTESSAVRATLYHCENSATQGSFVGLKKPLSRHINAGLARLGGSFTVLDGGVAEKIIQLTDQSDVLHLHNMHGYYLNFEKLLLAWKRRPIVWTWHDMWGATGRCGFSYDCSGWQQNCPKCPHTNYYPTAWIDRANYEYKRKSALYAELNNLTIVSPSQWLADIAIERGFNPSRVKTIPNPVDTNKFKLGEKAVAREALGFDKEKPMVLFVASDCNDKRKGYEDFVEICKGMPWQGVAVGKPPLQPAEHIYYAGVIKDQAEINRYYTAADIMVIPTYADNYPNTVIESLVSGTPVIGYDEGGVASQLDMPMCAVVTKGNWKAMRNKVEVFFLAGGKSASLAATLNIKAQERWAFNKIISHYEEIYIEARGSV